MKTKHHIIAIILTAAVLTAAVLLTGCAAGTRIATGPQHPGLSPEAVQLYQVPPPHYEIVGLVNSTARGARQFRVDEATRKLKKEAGLMGANGIIIQPPQSAGLFGRKTKLSGQAIYVLP